MPFAVDDPAISRLRLVDAADSAWRDSYVEALREGSQGGGEPRPSPEAIALAERDPDQFFATLVRQTGLTATPAGPTERVPGPLLWLVDGTCFIGALSIRTRLATPFLATYAGHVGYGARPSLYGRGYAKTMLRRGLTICAGLGLDEVLLTALSHNLASRRVIEANDGRLIDEIDYPYLTKPAQMARYRVKTV